MEMKGEQLIPVAQAEVWRGLNDPEVLKACIPGCESIERVTDTEYKVALTIAVGPVKAKFAGKLALSDLNPPNSYSLAFEGSGGAAGFAKGSAQVNLSTEGSATKLAYSTKANVGGKLAQIGSRLIDGVAMKTADEFFAKFKQKMAPAAAAAGPAEKAPAAPAPEAAPSGLNPMWIVAAVIVVMLAINYLLGEPKYIW
ncbi:MAG: carbon monoxide dehydrogenase subunit G [Betaproteobacteria bacterium]|nr:carbon monoxide dehydrogenase subunit G [Betaproteobacteria bacterium]MBI2960934.1 carbon monoxide dehydrogenase subunit G [Betaproteobacteria bacterium]